MVNAPECREFSSLYTLKTIIILNNRHQRMQWQPSQIPLGVMETLRALGTQTEPWQHLPRAPKITARCRRRSESNLKAEGTSTRRRSASAGPCTGAARPADATRRGRVGTQERAREETPRVGACIHPPGPTRCTVTDPVGGDGAKSRPTQAERRERARGARGCEGGCTWLLQGQHGATIAR